MLSLTIETQSKSGKRIVLTQDVPVCILPPDIASEELKEPKLNKFDAQIILPDLFKLKSILDRFRGVSNGVVVSANMNGILRLKIASDAVRIETQFSNLINPEIDTSADDGFEVAGQNQILENASQDPAIDEAPARFSWEFANASVDLKDIGRVLQCHVLSPSHVVCCISKDYGMVFYVYVGGMEVNVDHAGSITYYVPLKME